MPACIRCEPGLPPCSQRCQDRMWREQGSAFDATSPRNADDQTAHRLAPAPRIRHKDGTSRKLTRGEKRIVKQHMMNELGRKQHERPTEPAHPVAAPAA